MPTLQRLASDQPGLKEFHAAAHSAAFLSKNVFTCVNCIDTMQVNTTRHLIIINMKKDKRTQRLHDLMQQHHLDCLDVGDILGRTAQTVRVWRSAWKDRIIPADALQLLELKAPQFVAERVKSQQGSAR